MSENSIINKIIIPSETAALLKEGFGKFYSNSFVENQLNLKRAKDRSQIVKKLLRGVKNPKILEIGCGAGLQIVALNKLGFNTYGIEPDKHSYLAAKILLKANKIPDNKIKNQCGENLQFKEKFDLIISFQVLEHCKNPPKVFEKSYKHLNPGGKIYFVIPNYQSFWEGHYGIFWLPFLNKKLAKVYVSLIGKNPKLINNLNFIKPNLIRKILKKTGFEIISMGEEEFKKRMKKGFFHAYGSTKKILPFLKIIKRLKLNNIISNFMVKLDLFYPIIVIARKENDNK